MLSMCKLVHKAAGYGLHFAYVMFPDVLPRTQYLCSNISHNSAHNVFCGQITFLSMLLVRSTVRYYHP